MTKFSIFGKWLLGSANLATNTNPECHNFSFSSSSQFWAIEKENKFLIGQSFQSFE